MKTITVCILAIGFVLSCDAGPLKELSDYPTTGVIFNFDRLGTPLDEIVARSRATFVALDKTSQLSKESESRLEKMRCAGKANRSFFSSMSCLIAWIKLPSGRIIPVEEFGARVMIGDFLFISPPTQKLTVQPAAIPRL
jgi:hypothetical protein